YSVSHSLTLPLSTNVTPTLINYAYKALDILYVQGYGYKKAGVVLSGIAQAAHRQQLLFQDTAHQTKLMALMKTVDTLNQLWGTDTIRFAAQGSAKIKGRALDCSPGYTSNWNELMKAKA